MTINIRSRAQWRYFLLSSPASLPELHGHFTCCAFTCTIDQNDISKMEAVNTVVCPECSKPAIIITSYYLEMAYKAFVLLMPVNVTCPICDCSNSSLVYKNSSGQTICENCGFEEETAESSKEN